MSSVDQETQGSVINYLSSLVWDGKPRLDRWLVVCAGAADEPAVHRVSRGMLVAAVRRVRDPGCRLDQMPVLVGPQGCGKSSALRILAVTEGWFGGSGAVALTLDQREQVEILGGKWIVEMSELAAMDRAAVEGMKAFLSRSHDEVRLPYEQRCSRVARSFVVVGTTGQADFLQDGAGNRRFVPVTVQRFDLELLRSVRDQLWAEAVVVEARGERIDLGTD